MLETLSTRQLITFLFAVSLGLIFAAASMGCAELGRMDPMLKRTLDDQTKWSGGSSP